MKYLRLVSDIHLDHDPKNLNKLWYPPVMEEDQDTVLVIAGDLWGGDRIITNTYGTDETWIGRLSKQFHSVVIVLGNHDFWRENISYLEDSLKEKLRVLSNVHLLADGVVVIDHVKFVGGTLWTDYKKGDPLVLYSADNQINDYKHIRIGNTYKRISPTQILPIHKKTREFIFNNARRNHSGQKVVVVTHMAPCYYSIPKQLRTVANQYLNPLYYSDLAEPILDSEINYWFHGHVHSSVIYNIGDTVVVCNPRGYRNSGNPEFDPCYRIDVGV